MRGVNRRRFLAAGGLPALAFGTARPAANGAPAVAEDRTVHLSGDGIAHSPAQYAALLTRLLDEQAMTPDSYSLGGMRRRFRNGSRRAACCCRRRRAMRSCSG